jgi:hypothetical protein
MRFYASIALIPALLVGAFSAAAVAAFDTARTLFADLRDFAIDLFLLAPVLDAGDELALQHARRASVWERVTHAAAAFRAFLDRALTHRRYRAGMFGLDSMGGPQQLAI